MSRGAVLLAAPWLKPLRSAGIVGTGKTVSALMSMATVALAARALGTEAFGLLALVHGLVFGLSQLIRAQSWQAVIRYGSEALETSDIPRFQRLIKFTTILDILAACTGLVLLQLFMGPAATAFDLPAAMHDTARLYGFAILFMVTTASPLGLLRLFDRFDLIAVQTTVASAVRLAGAVWLFLHEGTLAGFLLVWFIAVAASRLVLLVMAWRETARRGYLTGIMKKKEKQLRPEPGIWRFIFGHNLSRGLFLSQAQFGLLMVGWLLGPAAAGLFRIAQQVAELLIKPAAKLLIPAIYPELAKLRGGDQFQARRVMMLRTAVLTGAGALAVFAVFVFWGRDIITLLAGSAFAGAYTPMLWLAAAGVITTFAFPLEPLLSSVGRVRQIVFSQLAGAGLYIALLYILIGTHGLSGAGMATFFAFSLGAAVMALFSRDLIGRRQAES